MLNSSPHPVKLTTRKSILSRTCKHVFMSCFIDRAQVKISEAVMLPFPLYNQGHSFARHRSWGMYVFAIACSFSVSLCVCSFRLSLALSLSLFLSVTFWHEHQSCCIGQAGKTIHWFQLGYRGFIFVLPHKRLVLRSLYYERIKVFGG